MNRQIRRCFVLIAATSLLASCSEESTVRDAIPGIWSMATFAGSRDALPCFRGNLFYFRDRYVDLPIASGNCDFGEYRADDARGTWIISVAEDGLYHMSLESANTVFSGDYVIQFESDSSRQDLWLLLVSQDLEFILRKGLLDMSSRQIEHLVKATSNAEAVLYEEATDDIIEKVE